MPIGNGAALLRSLALSGYVTPCWVRADGNRVFRLNSMPARLTIHCGSVEVLSSDPGLIGPPFDITFSGSQNPITDPRFGAQGLTVGEEWGDCRITGGVLHGWYPASTQPYRDPAISFAGSFNPNHRVGGIITGVDALAGTSGSVCGGEIELRLRQTIAPGVMRAYEVFISPKTDASRYLQCFAWLGGYDQFSPQPGFISLDAGNGCPVFENGDKLEAEAFDTTFEGNPAVYIAVYHNESFLVDGVDTTVDRILDGGPGAGFYPGTQCLTNAEVLALQHTFGFTRLFASNL